MKLAWMYNAFFALADWAVDAWNFITSPVADPIALVLAQIGLEVALPDFLYNFSVWEFVLGSGLTIWFGVTLLTWILDILP